MTNFEYRPQLTILGDALTDKASIDAALAETISTDSPLPLARLPGSFSGVIREAETTWAFADLASQFPVYFTEGEKAAFGFSAHELAQQSGSELDNTTLAAQICGLVALTEGYSMFQGVHRLTGGEHVRITQGSVRLDTYETLLPSPFIDSAEAVSNSRQSIEDAIRYRANTNLTTDFSGGLDSTTLGFAAARIHNQVVPGFIHYSAEHAAGDLAYARRFAALDPRIELHESQTDRLTLPFTQLDPTVLPFLADEPYRGVAIFEREQARKHALSKLHSALHLNGIGGDALYDGRPYIADFLRDDLFEQANTAAVTLGRTYLTDPERILSTARFQADITLPEAFGLLADSLADPAMTSKGTGWLPRLAEPADWLTPDARLALAERAMTLAAKKKNWPSYAGIGDFNFGLQVRDSGDAQRHQRYLMEAAFTLAAPFLDNNVIRAAARLPARDRNIAGAFKPLLRDAASGHLAPEQIYAERQGKGNYTAEMYQGVRRSLPTIHALLANSRLAALGIIEPARVQKTLDTLNSSQSFPLAALANLVSIEIWLRQREMHDIAAPPIAAHTKPQNRTSVEPPREFTDILKKSYALPSHLRVLAGPEQIVIFNLTTEQLEIGDATTSYVLQVLDKTGNPQQAIEALASIYHTVPRAQLQQDVLRLIHNMIERDMLMESSDRLSTIVPWGVTPAVSQDHTLGEVMRVRSLLPNELFALSPDERTLGETVLRQVLELKKQGFSQTTALLRHQRESNTRNATYEEAHRNLVIAHRSAGTIGRVACYERSLATVLIGNAQGVSTNFVIGAAFDPPRFHAWPEVNDVPVVTGADEPVTGVYQAWLRS